MIRQQLVYVVVGAVVGLALGLVIHGGSDRSLIATVSVSLVQAIAGGGVGYVLARSRRGTS